MQKYKKNMQFEKVFISAPTLPLGFFQLEKMFLPKMKVFISKQQKASFFLIFEVCFQTFEDEGLIKLKF